ncbi:efflux RND transporter periplasmic adaptor subunit [Novosphingobium sp. 1949]|uniref:Efflux RND transporter periplasmic adaptor subunit n=1 Tax=Novosphingobium organovorum TaxID=2930092 RepID=A0ABT0B9E8_9SPHN|nr:efflux RND transporter periplasmic adaptor subunit [Novosphingobium organovorum]MCJ2181648.1 efflux RND transporter periplasmic adaptor subunit [Novosphingobium organovorum]
MKHFLLTRASLSSKPALAALALTTLALGACSQSDGDTRKEARETQVGFVVAKPSTVPIPVALNARTVAFETSEVRPQVTGVIQKVYFAQGTRVRAGQPLFQIDPSLYRAAVNQAQANLASARASAAAARLKADRYKPLADMEAVAKQDYTDALADARVADAAVAQYKATLDTARINLRYTTVPAPISGIIGRNLSTVGALVSASQTDALAVIQRSDPMYVDMQQSASELVALRRQLRTGGVTPGSTQVHLKLDDGSIYPLAGTVKFSEVTVDEDTGTVTLRAQFPNPDGLLLPGMFVTAQFDQANAPGAYLIPQGAIQRDFDGTGYIMVVGNDGKAVRRNVTAERTYKTYSVVTKGVQTGDKIIVQGLNGLRQGAALKAVAASSEEKVGASASAAKGS